MSEATVERPEGEFQAPAPGPSIEVEHIAAQREQVIGRVNGRIVVDATSYHAEQLDEAAHGRSQGPWHVTVWGLPGDVFTVNHQGSDIGIVVQRLTYLIATAVTGVEPSAWAVKGDIREAMPAATTSEEQQG